MTSSCAALLSARRVSGVSRVRQCSAEPKQIPSPENLHCSCSLPAEVRLEGHHATLSFVRPAARRFCINSELSIVLRSVTICY